MQPRRIHFDRPLPSGMRMAKTYRESNSRGIYTKIGIHTNINPLNYDEQTQSRRTKTTTTVTAAMTNKSYGDHGYHDHHDGDERKQFYDR